MKKHSWTLFIFLWLFVFSFGLGAQHTPKSASFPLDKESFYQASQSLYDSITKAVKEASKEAICDHMVDTSMYDADLIRDHAKAWIALATKMVDALPTIKQIQASLPKPIATRIRSFEILHAFLLVRAKIQIVYCYSNAHSSVYDDDEDFDPPEAFDPAPLNKEALLENFFASLKLVYTLLIQSAQQGLDVNAYLHFQQANIPMVKRLEELLEDRNLASANPTIFAQLKTLYSSARPIPGLSLYSIDLGPYTGQAYYNEMFKPLGLDGEFFQALRQYYMVALYMRADGLKEIANQSQPLEQILKSFPHMCFNTALSKEMKRACRDVLTRPNAPLQEYLRAFRLISFEDQPCLYLTPQNTIQTFRSKNPLCRALQAHPPQMGAPLPKDLMIAFQNAQDFLKNIWNSPRDKDDNPHPPSKWFLTLQQRIRAILQATPLASLQDSKWADLLDYESLHLLGLLQGSIAPFNPSGIVMPPLLLLASTPAPLLAQEYTRLLDFIYTPLIQARQQGLDPSFYLHNLKDSQFHAIHPCATKDYCTLPPNIPPSPWLEDFKSAQLAWDLIQDKNKFHPSFIRDWLQDWYDAKARWLKNLSASQQQALKLWDLHYKKRVEAFFYNKDFYTDTLLHPERISAERLRANPSPCFTPKYLNPVSAQNCQQILKAQSFNPFRYREYLRSFMLLGIDSSPCLYLNAKEQLRGFNSNNPSCKALQAWALYTPPKEIALPPFFLQHVEAMHTRLEEALQKAHTQDPTCEQDRASLLKGVLPELEQQAQSALKSLPLLSNFKPRHDKEKALLKHIQQQAMFLLFALLEGGSKDNCQKSPPTPTKQIAQTFIRALNFIYQPLMRAHAQELDAWWYVHTLAQIQKSHEEDCACRGCRTLGDDLKSFVKRRYLVGNTYDGANAYHITKDVEIIEMIYDFTRGNSNLHLSYNLLDALQKKNNIDQEDAEDQEDIEDEDQEDIENPVNYFIRRRVAQFLDAQEVLSVDQGDDVYNTPLFFPRYPSACLRPEYLRPSTQTECMQMLKSEKYDVSALKAYLQDYIMVSLQGVPCLYLDEKKQIKGLGSASALCKSLLKPLSQKGWFYHDEGH